MSITIRLYICTSSCLMMFARAGNRMNIRDTAHRVELYRTCNLCLTVCYVNSGGIRLINAYWLVRKDRVELYRTCNLCLTAC